jgi:hypothetical protein
MYVISKNHYIFLFLVCNIKNKTQTNTRHKPTQDTNQHKTNQHI